ncbi:hypothetical protein CRM22_006133 [Opisthorchis felineus]|uniref:Uncharacterized protein n=1 Tax=Opisthorchis felineus TaxID=147828 RepID=A0A4S2LUQ3_OPIFE|nr:hypothetical protein CRM22_006133 [Opisthorchis felineus]
MYASLARQNNILEFMVLGSFGDPHSYGDWERVCLSNGYSQRLSSRLCKHIMQLKSKSGALLRFLSGTVRSVVSPVCVCNHRSQVTICINKQLCFVATAYLSDCTFLDHIEVGLHALVYMDSCVYRRLLRFGCCLARVYHILYLTSYLHRSQFHI